MTTEAKLQKIKSKLTTKLGAVKDEYEALSSELADAGASVTSKALSVEARNVNNVIKKVERVKASSDASDAALLHEDLFGLSEDHSGALDTLGFKSVVRKLSKLSDSVAKLEGGFASLRDGYEAFEQKQQEKAEKEEAKALKKQSKKKQKDDDDDSEEDA